MKSLLACALLLVAAPLWAAERLQTSAGPVVVEAMAEGLNVPWGMAHLPDGSVLITEREGRLLRLVEGRLLPVGGVPQVATLGQGGLLDVVAARDFATTRTVFLTYAEARDRGAGTTLAKARLSEDGSQLTDLTVLYRQGPGSSRGQHFGSRVVEAPDGTLFLTIGDRGQRPDAQRLDRANGKVIRVTRDGRVPGDNPFVGTDGARAEIWSYGHRNPQGAALDGDGQLWTVEHGARGGDEVNRPRPGRNYGWPVISYGRHYSGAPIGEGTAKQGMEQPAFYWDPSIAPSGMAILSGGLFDGWQGDMLIGSLKFDYISRLEVSGDTAREVERLFEGRFGRIRDIRQAPDGSVWFLSEGDGVAYRMTPAE